MREIRTSGSVRGEGGNPLAYSTSGVRPTRGIWNPPPYGGRTLPLSTPVCSLPPARASAILGTKR